MGKADLDLLVAKGRLDGHCQLRRDDTPDWQWIEAVYPQLIVHVAPDTPDELPEKPDLAAEVDLPSVACVPLSPLRPCPDCGQMTSRRASLCPHCGCPLSADERAHSALAPIDPSTLPATGNRRRVVFIVAGLVGGVLLVGGMVCFAAIWMIGSFIGEQKADLDATVKELIDTPPPLPPEPPPVEPPAERPATAEQIAEWKSAAAADAARRVDAMAREAHRARAQFEGMIQTLHSIIDDPMGSPGDDLTPTAQAEPYVSQYDALNAECFKHLLETLPDEGIDWAEIQRAADRWREDKCRPLNEELHQQLPGPLGL